MAGARRGWPKQTAAAGKLLVERLAIYPGLCARRRSAGSTRRCAPPCCASIDAEGSRAPTTGRPAPDRAPLAPPGAPASGQARRRRPSVRARELRVRASRRSSTGRQPASARRSRHRRGCSRRAATHSHAVCRAADALRRSVNGDASAMSSPATSTTPTSATSAASSAPSPRASSARICAAGPTTSTSTRSQRRVEEAWERGATEVCLQGGIHPDYTGGDLSRDLPRHQGGGARHPHPRLLAARDLAGRQDARAARSPSSCAS